MPRRLGTAASRSKPHVGLKAPPGPHVSLGGCSSGGIRRLVSISAFASTRHPVTEASLLVCSVRKVVFGKIEDTHDEEHFFDGAVIVVGSRRALSRGPDRLESCPVNGL